MHNERAMSMRIPVPPSTALRSLLALRVMHATVRRTPRDTGPITPPITPLITPPITHRHPP